MMIKKIGRRTPGMRTVLIAFAALVFLSCDELLEIDLPSDQLTVESVFVDSTTIVAAVNALYTQNFYSNPLYYYLIPYYLTVMSDESTHNVTSLEVFNQNSYEENTAAVGNIWTYAYQSIFLSNSLMERLSGSTAISETRKKNYISEAKYFRAYSHFVLLNFYGDIPLVLESDYKKAMLLPREETAVVYGQIITDLEEAEREIGANNTSNSKITGAAVTALLARAHLYAGNYAAAEEKAGNVIANPAFALETPDKVFLRSSKETILRMQDFLTSYLGRSYWGGYICRLANYTRFRDGFAEAFEPGDLRREMWVGRLSNRAYYQCTKYRQSANPSNSELAEDHVFLRLGEQYLIRAEARMRQGKLPEAIDDLNVIRRRASLSDLPASLGQEEVLAAVAAERRFELFAEEGHRWWDMRRLGIIDEVLGAIADKKWRSHKAIWPIPEDQLNANPMLTPNPGYGTND